MAKKKIYKDDGVTEDFDAEALEPDEASADAGNVSDLLQSDAGKADAGKPEAGPAASTDTATDKSDLTNGGSDKGSSQPSAPSATSDASASSADASDASAASDAPAEAPAEQPKLEEAHEEAKPAVELAPDVFDELKNAANIVQPALSKFHALEDEIKKLEAEAKNRFDFARQKAVEFVGALETLFKRG